MYVERKENWDAPSTWRINDIWHTWGYLEPYGYSVGNVSSLGRDQRTVDRQDNENTAKYILNTGGK